MPLIAGWVKVIAFIFGCTLALAARADRFDIPLKPDVPDGYPDRVGRFQKPLRQDITTLRMVRREDGKYDFEFPTVRDVPALLGVDLRPFVLRVPKLAEGDPALVRYALIQRELNRNQTRYDLPAFGGSVWIANNCLKRGLWEIGLDKNDDKGQLTVFHAWFEMPKDEYARLYKQINGDDSTMASCEGYPELSHFAIPLDHLRQIVHDRPIAAVDTNLHDTIYQLSEQSRKAKLIVSAAIENYSDLLSTTHQPIKTAKFSEPGYYNRADPVQFDLAWLAQPSQAHRRTIKAKNLDHPLSELEIAFANGHRLILALDLAGLAARSSPPKDEKDCLRVTFGLSTPEIYANATERGKEFDNEPLNYLLLLDHDGNNIDNHKAGLDRVFAWREADTNALHLYLVGYERIMLVEHLSMSYPGSPAQPAAQGG